jgi:S1-C subfamily serine protease
MKLLNLIRKPLVAAILGAVVIAVPVSAVYVAGATRAAATPAALTADAAGAAPAAPAPVAAPAIALPDFSSMVQRYGPAVVNISVVTRVSAMNSQGDGDDAPGNGGGNDNNPFGPNSPFPCTVKAPVSSSARTGSS